MITFLLVVHIILAITLVIVILLQRSEGGALGIGGSSMGHLFSGRSMGNFLTRTTAILAICFFLTSLTLAILVDRLNKDKKEYSLADQIEQGVQDQAVPTSSESTSVAAPQPVKKVPLP